ncbi:MAG TPA: aminopeptidase N [Oligoflexia bacterium]|nr:aminopeptidase N [Oligoflexia bacterium]HMR24676.1 aminopeptidase N [Oligoflexia bacterium]
MKNTLKILGLSLTLCLLNGACSKRLKGNDSSMNRENKPNLSQTYAEFRSKHISNVSYNLSFDLSHGKEKFSGISSIHFEYKPQSQPVTIDFVGGTVKSVKINEQGYQANYNGNFLSIDPAQLNEGENTIEITFEHAYSNDGAGLYRFEDTEDNTSYIYSNFEPYDANKMFPCFDQPDLKASYELDVVAPKSWQVISAAQETEVKAKGDVKHWHFPKTKRFSTYIFPLHAGDYTYWTSDYNGMSMRLFARKSLAKYVNQEFWFDISKKGFEFFNAYFDYDYPFGKYDQVIVPDFNAGAMENTAAITFSEAYIKKGKYTRSNEMNIAEVILHEMAHMWFGNLVTMKWWNDLWLNESFATYMAYLAVAENTQFKEAWHDFYAGIKVWAYTEDQRITTHPIEATIETTDQAFANFDGITYGKGASSLKQLAYYIGADEFKKGMRHYFKTFAYKNTQLSDFVGSLEKGAQKSLQAWVGDWLRNKGLNTIKADLAGCKPGEKIKKFDLIQGVASGDDVLRAHKVNVALYTVEKGKLTAYANETVQYDGKKTSVNKFEGKTCPAFVFVNEADNDFVKVVFDDASVKFLKDNLNLFESAHHRSMIWRSLWDMVEDQKLSIDEYLTIVDAHLDQEGNVDVSGQIVNTLIGRRGSHHAVLYYVKNQKEKHASLQKKYEDFFWKKLNAAQVESDFQSHWYNTYVSMLESDQAQEQLLSLLNGKTKIKGLTIDQDKRWGAIKVLNSLAHPKAKDLLKAEQEKDKSSGGVKSAIACEVIYPDKASKNEWYNKLMNNELDSLAKKAVVISNLLPNGQEEFKADFYDRLYDAIVQKNKEGDLELLTRFTIGLAPVSCDPASVERMGKFIKKNQADFLPIVKKNLLIMHESYETCVNVRQYNKL